MEIAMGLRLLLVEDESLIAMMIEDMAEELGHAVVAKAVNIKEATDLIEVGGFDVALLDVNLAGEFSYGLAEMLGTRDVPFIFTTGYGAGIEERWRTCRILQKPFAQDQLKVELAALENSSLGPSFRSSSV
jgi:CheY-like chemotaxis protein